MSDEPKPVAESLKESRTMTNLMFNVFEMAGHSFGTRDDIRTCGAMSQAILVFVRSLLKIGVTPEKMRETLNKYVDGANDKPVCLVMLPPSLMAERGITSGDTLYEHKPADEYALATGDEEKTP